MRAGSLADEMDEMQIGDEEVERLMKRMSISPLSSPTALRFNNSPSFPTTPQTRLRFRHAATPLTPIPYNPFASGNENWWENDTHVLGSHQSSVTGNIFNQPSPFITRPLGSSPGLGPLPSPATFGQGNMTEVQSRYSSLSDLVEKCKVDKEDQ